MSSRLYAVRVCAVLCLLAGLAACGSTGEDTQSDGGKVEIGAIVSLSGPLASVGEEQRTAGEFTVEAINADGGVGGTDLELTIEDDESQVDIAVQAARQFINEGMPVILGPAHGSGCNAVREVAERAGVVHYCFSGAPFEFTPHFFAAELPPEAGLGRLPAAFFASQGWDSAACLKTADASGEAYAVPLEEVASTYNVDVVATETFAPGANDVVPQLSNIRSASPEVLYSCASGLNLAPVVRGVNQLGWEIPVFAGLGSVQYEVAESVAADLPEGGLFSNGNALLVPDQISEDHPRYDVVTEFVAKYEEASGGERPSAQAGNIADALNIVTNVMSDLDESERSDGTAIAEGIEQVKDFKGVSSSYSFGPDTHRGTELEPMIVRWTEDGTFEIVDLDDLTL